MTPENLEMQLKQGNLESIYLLYGEERYLLESTVKRIKNLFGELVKGINFIVIDENNIGSLISDMETPSFGFEKKLILVKDTRLLKKEAKKKNSNMLQIQEKLNSYLQENEKTIKESMVLVIVEQEVDKIALLSTIEKQGTVCNFEKLKPIAIKKRLKSICTAYGVQIEDSTLDIFIENCGTSMQELINEIRKVIEYAGKGGKIQKEDLERLTIRQTESVIFDLTDSLGSKDTKKAIEILHNLIYAKEPVQRILIMLYNHFKKIYLTKIAIKEQKDIVSSLGLKPNQVFLTTKYKRQANYFSEEELKNFLEALRDLDYHSKIGLIDVNLGLEAILCSIN